MREGERSRHEGGLGASGGAYLKVRLVVHRYIGTGPARLNAGLQFSNIVDDRTWETERREEKHILERSTKRKHCSYSTGVGEYHVVTYAPPGRLARHSPGRPQTPSQ